MEKPSSPSPVGQRSTLGPLKIKYTLGKLHGYSSVTPAYVKEIAGDSNKLKAFQAGNPSLSHLARIADITGARGQFPPGCSAIADLRAALLAKHYELFFAALTLWGGHAFIDCQSDPVITAIFENWGKAARRGNRTARFLLERLGKALITTPTHLRPRKTARQEADQKAVDKAVARIAKAAHGHQENGLPNPCHAWQQAVVRFASSSLMSAARKQRVYEKLNTLPAVQALGLSFPPPRPSLVLRGRSGAPLPRGGETMRKVSPP